MHCTTVIEDDSKLHQPKDTMTSGGLNGLDKMQKEAQVHCTTVTEDDSKLHQPKDTMTSGGLNGLDKMQKEAQVT